MDGGLDRRSEFGAAAKKLGKYFPSFKTKKHCSIFKNNCNTCAVKTFW